MKSNRIAIIFILSIFLGSCTSVRLLHRADFSFNQRQETGSLKLEHSIPTNGLALFCGLTFFAYGGACWGYLMLPTRADQIKIEMESERLLEAKFPQESISFDHYESIKLGYSSVRDQFKFDINHSRNQDQSGDPKGKQAISTDTSETPIVAKQELKPLSIAPLSDTSASDASQLEFSVKTDYPEQNLSIQIPGKTESIPIGKEPKNVSGGQMMPNGSGPILLLREDETIAATQFMTSDTSNLTINPSEFTIGINVGSVFYRNIEALRGFDMQFFSFEGHYAFNGSYYISAGHSEAKHSKGGSSVYSGSSQDSSKIGFGKIFRPRRFRGLSQESQFDFSASVKQMKTRLKLTDDFQSIPVQSKSIGFGLALSIKYPLFIDNLWASLYNEVVIEKLQWKVLAYEKNAVSTNIGIGLSYDF